METFEKVFTLNMSVSMPKSDREMMKQLRKISQTLDWQDITQNIIFVPVHTGICQSSNGIRTQLFESEPETGEAILEK